MYYGAGKSCLVFLFHKLVISVDHVTLPTNNRKKKVLK